jgi:hypothetical protein
MPEPEKKQGADPGAALGAIGSLIGGILKDVPYATVQGPGGPYISLSRTLSGQARRDRMIDESSAQLQQLQMMKVQEDMAAQQAQAQAFEAAIPVLQQKGLDPTLVRAGGQKAVGNLISSVVADDIGDQNAVRDQGLETERIKTQGAETRKNTSFRVGLEKNKELGVDAEKRARDKADDLKKQQTAFANLVAAGLDTETARAIVTNPGVQNTLLGGTPQQQAGAARGTLQAGLDSGAIDPNSPIGKLSAANMQNAPSGSDQAILDTFLKTQPRAQVTGTPADFGFAGDDVTKRAIDSEIKDATRLIAESDSILSTLDPSNMSLLGRGYAGWAETQAWVAGGKSLTKGQQKAVESVTTSRVKAITTSAQIRKFLTGVAGSEKELVWFEGMLPDVDKDSDLTFVTKVKVLREAAVITVDRLNALKTNGISLDDISEDARRRLVEESVSAALSATGGSKEKLSSDEDKALKEKFPDAK